MSSKATRFVAGFATPNTVYKRAGFCFDPEPQATEALYFVEDVTDPSYKEFWSDELELFHNPNAEVPMPAEWLPYLTQYWFKDGEPYAVTPEGRVLTSMTGVETSSATTKARKEITLFD